MIKVYDENHVAVDLAEFLKSITVEDVRQLISWGVHKPAVKEFLEELLGDE